MLKNIWQWLLQTVMNYIIGKNVFEQVQTLVADVALNSDLSGAQKKEKVLEKAKDISGDFATHMLNLSIESAVILMKEKAQKLAK